MILESIVSERYVHALFNAAKQIQEERFVEQDLIALKIEIHRSGLKSFIENPRYPLQIKLKTIEKISHMFESKLTANFLRILLLHARINLFEQIVDRYLELLRESKKIVLCKILLTEKPSEIFLAKIKKELERITRKNVDLQVYTDPTILGGIRLKIKHYVLDVTYLKYLESMKDRLLEGHYLTVGQ